MAKKKEKRPAFWQRTYSPKGQKGQGTKVTSPEDFGKTREEIEEEKQQKAKVTKHARIVSILIIIILVTAFFGRWVFAVMNNYYRTFFEVSADVPQALESVKGLDLTEDEQSQLLPLQEDWDYFTQSHLRDELEMTASDGTKLHAYLYKGTEDKTVVVLQQFGQDGTADFLPGSVLGGEDGCSILLLDARATGDSSGDYFSYGYLEQQDLADWLSYMDSVFGKQEYLIWGTGAGANTALFADEDGLLPDNVAGIVAESPYGSLDKLARENIMSWFTLTPFPFVNAIEFRLSISHAGFTQKDTNLSGVLSNTPQDIPVLFLTSSGDQYIQEEFTSEVYQGFSGEKALVEGTGSHGTVFREKEDDILDWIQEKTGF